MHAIQIAEPATGDIPIRSIRIIAHVDEQVRMVHGSTLLFEDFAADFLRRGS